MLIALDRFSAIGKHQAGEAFFFVLVLVVVFLAVVVLAEAVFLAAVFLVVLAAFVVSVVAAAVLLFRDRPVFLVPALALSASTAVPIAIASTVSPSGREAFTLPCLM